MIRAARMMLTCHWSARRIQRYLDSDPAALLHPRQVHRVQAHLAECAKCSAAAAEYRQIDTALSRWALRRIPDPESIAQLHHVMDRLVRGELQ